MSQQRRIPAGKSNAYAAWSIPAVSQGVVVKAEAVGAGQRRLASQDVSAEIVRGESFEKQLTENIKAGRFAQGVSARDLEAIVRDAAREGRQQGYDEGYASGQEQGFNDGRTEGLGAGRSFMEDAARRFAELLETLQQPLLGQELELRTAMLEMVTRIARSVIRTELRLQPESIACVVREALAALPLGADNVRVFVCPSDHELLADFGGGKPPAQLLVDDSLQPGDCRVVSAESLVEYTLSSRFDALVDQFLPRSPAAADAAAGQ